MAPQPAEQAHADQETAPEVRETPEPESANEDDLPEYEPLTPELVEDDAVRNDFMLRLVVVLLAFLLACTEITESLTLVHVKTGQYIAENGWLPPANDVFSYTAADRPWINLGWLFDLFAAGIYSLGGAVGLSLAKAGLAAITFYVVIQAGRAQVSSWWGSICAALALLVCVPQFTMQSELITLLGTALVLWTLRRWQSEPEANAPWLLIPIILLWSNLDPRAFLGLALVFLIALGETIGAWVGRSSLLTGTRLRALWIVAAGCLVAAMVNPFGWHSLTAPAALYGGEYAGWRSLIGPGVETLPPGLLQNYPMTNPVFWRSLNVHTVAGLVLMAAAAVTFVLNRRNVPVSHLLVFLGFVGFAVAGTHELAAASIVCAVLATINGQKWYQANFRQTYSIDLSERLFSTGGRAVTALALFALAYLAVSGRLMGPEEARTGIGLEQPMQAAIAGMQEDLGTLDPEHQVFNFLLTQGDLAIWLDRKVFADSRLPLYTRGGDENLIERHLQVRDALLSSDAASASQDRAIWREAFDKYRITHAIPYMGGARPNYASYFRMLASEDWQLTHLGPASAVFCRGDLQQLDSYRRQHEVDFGRQAFEESAEDLPTRGDWARPASWYETTLFLPAETRSNDVQLARHQIASLQFALQTNILPQAGQELDRGVAALALLTIRNANQGLAADPNNASGYHVVGDAFSVLKDFETQLCSMAGQSPWWKRRFIQAVNAYRQALAVRPDDPSTDTAIQTLRNLYFAHGFYDLALEMAREYASRAPDFEDLSEVQLGQLEQNRIVIDQLSEQVAAVEEEIARQFEAEPVPMAAAQFARNQGCVRLALKHLDQITPETLQPLERAHLELFRSVLLLEAGEAEKASLELGKLEGYAEQFPEQLASVRWRPQAALTALANGQYSRAIELWSAELQDYERVHLQALVETLPMAPQPAEAVGAETAAADLWAANRTTATAVSANALDVAADALLNLAACHLEMGQPERAQESLERLLSLHPETSLRPLAAKYHAYITREPAEMLPPSAWIPVWPEIFAPEPKESASVR